jgi:hypothetical protein
MHCADYGPSERELSEVGIHSVRNGITLERTAHYLYDRRKIVLIKVCYLITYHSTQLLTSGFCLDSQPHLILVRYSRG